MFDYVYLIMSVFCVSSTGVLGGYYTRRTTDKKDASALYGFVELCAVFVLWCVLFAMNPSFDVAVLPYSLAFAIFFAMGMIGRIFALKTGSVVLTSLIVQSSLLAVSIWGIIFWNAPFTWNGGVGLTLVALALWLCLYSGKQEKTESKKISWKWLVFCLISFVGNTGCTITQRMQQTQFNGQHGNMLMMFASLCSALVGFAVYAKSDKKDTKVLLKQDWYWPVAAGVGNVFLNVFVMLMAVSSLSPTLIYPTIAVGGLIITTCFSVLAFREKLKWWQWIGVAIGIIATAILS